MGLEDADDPEPHEVRGVDATDTWLSLKKRGEQSCLNVVAVSLKMSQS